MTKKIALYTLAYCDFFKSELECRAKFFFLLIQIFFWLYNLAYRVH